MTTPQGPMQQPSTWDAVAPGYAETIVAQMRPHAEEALRLAQVGATDHVLDVACGPGTLALVAASRAARVLAVDFSPEMIAETRARGAKAGLANVEATVMDAQDLALPDASFDAVFCLFGFMFFPDRGRAFAELLRVLRPGGRAVIATWAPIERRPLMAIGFDAMGEAFPQVPRPSKGDLQVPEECVAEMTAAGFTDVSTQTFTASVHVDSPEAYARIVELSGPLAVMKKTMPAEGWNELSAKLGAAIAKRIPATGADLAAEALLTRGVRAQDVRLRVSEEHDDSTR